METLNCFSWGLNVSLAVTCLELHWWFHNHFFLSSKYLQIPWEYLQTSLSVHVSLFDVGETPADIHCVKSVRIQSLFWFAFSRIRTEYEEIRSISPYSVRMRENTDLKGSNTDTSRSDLLAHYQQWWYQSKRENLFKVNDENDSLY